MAKTIVFKPEFEKKLKDLRIKTKFVKNFNKKEWPNSINNYECNIENMHKQCLNATSWYAFVVYAFNWDITPEKQEYWSNIANA